MRCSLARSLPAYELDVRFGELAERVGEIEKTVNLEARFAKLAHEVKNGFELRKACSWLRSKALGRRCLEACESAGAARTARTARQAAGRQRMSCRARAVQKRY